MGLSGAPWEIREEVTASPAPDEISENWIVFLESPSCPPPLFSPLFPSLSPYYSSTSVFMGRGDDLIQINKNF